MAEPEEPIAPVARYVAWLLAALIGMVLALQTVGERTPAAVPAASASEAPSPEPDTTDFETLQAVLVERARDGIQRRGDFGVIAVALTPDGGLMVREEPGRDAGSAEVRLLRDRIERGETRAWGWAETLHAPGEKSPDAVYFEVCFDKGHVKRREMHFGRTSAGTLEFYAPTPVSRRPGAPFAEVTPAPAEAASPTPQYPPGVPRVDAPRKPLDAEKR